METKLEMARRHVREGAAHVARQREIAVGLRADGLPAGAAEQLLITFENLQEQHEAHLARLLAEDQAP